MRSVLIYQIAKNINGEGLFNALLQKPSVSPKIIL